MATIDPKIIDLLNQEKNGKVPVSLEYFPPRTEEGVKVRHFVRF
jgi:5,10-methylenetetrahydrofolate reductase